MPMARPMKICCVSDAAAAQRRGLFHEDLWI
jgi:hypothetical protein